MLHSIPYSLDLTTSYLYTTFANHPHGPEQGRFRRLDKQGMFIGRIIPAAALTRDSLVEKQDNSLVYLLTHLSWTWSGEKNVF